MGNIQTMIFRSLCAFTWFKNIEKMLLQMTSGFLQLESTICSFQFLGGCSVGTSLLVPTKLLGVA
jgi:hypothetical protein